MPTTTAYDVTMRHRPLTSLTYLNERMFKRNFEMSSTAISEVCGSTKNLLDFAANQKHN
jgi:hypothetical protein